jgi:hypothetical protein
LAEIGSLKADLAVYVEETEKTRKHHDAKLASLDATLSATVAKARVDELEKRFVAALEGVTGIEHFATREDLKRSYSTLFA